MKKSLVTTLGLFAVAMAVSASIQVVEKNKKLGPDFFAKKQHRVVTISLTKPHNLSDCSVDYPVAVVAKHLDQTIAWAAEDYEFWVVFDDTPGPIASNTIDVPSNTETPDMPITTANFTYYKYAIYSVNPSGGGATPCKKSGDDHDTGLNVKP